MKRVFSFKNVIIVVGLLLILFIFHDGRDIDFVLHNIDDFEVQTIPYNGDIEFNLQSSDILNELDEPKKLETIHNTDVYLWSITEQENTISGEKEIDILIGLDSHFTPQKGKMVSLTRISQNNNNINYSKAAVLEVYNEKGNLVKHGKGYGDSDGQFEQHVLFVVPKEEITQSDDLLFKISGLHILEYKER